jgi:hypothetical protein
MPQLHAALYGRSLAALRVWLGEANLAVNLTMVDPDDDRGLERSGDTITVTLPFAWLTEVWAREMTTIFGRLCLGAKTDDGVHWTLDTVAPDLTTTAQLSISID